MNIEYDIFEILPNGSVNWRESVQGKQSALEMLTVMGKRTCNECFAADLRTQNIIARVNRGTSTAQFNASEHQDATS